ncbi:hypothetical protein WJX77_009068 [Trebouxia sp. C0004]
MVRSSLAKSQGDIAETKRRISLALDRYGAFAGAIRRADVSAQISGAKVLENFASIAVLDQLLLRNSADLRRFFATALGKADLAALLRSPSASVQLAALRASNALSQHVETLPSASLPWIVRLLQGPDGASELAVSILRHLIRPFGPSTVWQNIHDGRGNEMLLTKVEAWTRGGSSAASHLRLLCYLLQSSLAAQRQLFEDPCQADRWTSALLQLLQQSASESDAEVIAATVHAVSSMAPFINAVENNSSNYSMLAQAAAAALQAGHRMNWKDAECLAVLATTACNLLDTVACIVPPHVQPQKVSSHGACQAADHQASQDGECNVVPALVKALQPLLSQKREGVQMHSPWHRVLSAALKATCVLLLPPQLEHGSDAKASPWLSAVSPTLPSQLVGLLSKDGSDHAVDTWCWQALYLLQAQLSASQIDQILQHPAAQRIPPTSILTLDPLYCSYSTLRVVLACKSATRHAATFRHFCQPPPSPSSRQQAFHCSLPQAQASMGSSAFQAQAARQWPQDGSQGHRHHLLLPKALPQGNLSRYFDLACITAGLRCLAGQQDAWEDAWLVLNHALGNWAQEDGAAWTSAIIASLQALTEAGATACLPPHICQGLLQLAHTSPTASSSCTVAMPGEVAYGDINGSSGSKGSLVPPPLQQQENSQLQLWWVVATAACCCQLGLPSDLGETMRGLLVDDSIADVVFELQKPQETVLAHQAIIAGRCPKLFQAVQQQWRLQQQQQSSSQQQPQQQGHDMSGGLTRLQLGKQVRAGTFKHVLEYLYTGQVQTLSSGEERTALRKLAHALDLPQLAALAAASRPVAAARFVPMNFRSIAPCGPTSFPWDSFLSQEECDQLQAQLQQQHQADSCCALDTEAVCEATDAAETGSEEVTVNQQLHPALAICTHTTREIQLPVTMPTPAHALPHEDLLLVPGRSSYGRTDCANTAQSGSNNEHPQAIPTIVDVDGDALKQMAGRQTD